jgi:hypothetical protein
MIAVHTGNLNLRGVHFELFSPQAHKCSVSPEFSAKRAPIRLMELYFKDRSHNQLYSPLEDNCLEVPLDNDAVQIFLSRYLANG